MRPTNGKTQASSDKLNLKKVWSQLKEDPPGPVVELPMRTASQSGKKRRNRRAAVA